MLAVCIQSGMPINISNKFNLTDVIWPKAHSNILVFAGHVIKVTAAVSGSPDKKKVFVNICHNEALGKPTHEKKKKPNGSFGLQWSIPHSFR